MQEHIKEELNKALIHPLSTPYSAPSSSSLRRAVTCNWLLTIACSLRHGETQIPFPLINKLFEKLSGAKFFSKIELTTAYNQIRVK